MHIIRIDKITVSQAVTEAVRTLKERGIIAYPTETFYGLGVLFDMTSVLQTIFILKKRIPNTPLPLIIGSQDQLIDIAHSPGKTAQKLIDTFWPGPLTLLLKAKPCVSEYITGRTGKVGVRIPGKSFALKLVQHINYPITTTSANISGMPPSRDAQTVLKYFHEKIDLIIDDGTTAGGKPSTIVDVSGDTYRIVREGVISSDRIRQVL